MLEKNKKNLDKKNIKRRAIMNIYRLISIIGINFGSYFALLYLVLFSILMWIKYKEKTPIRETMGKKWCDAFFVFLPLLIFALLGVGVFTNIKMDLNILSYKGFWNKLFVTYMALSILIAFIVYRESKKLRDENK